MNSPEFPTDVLPDVLAPGLSLVFCGTAAGTASARRGAYYAGPGNRFWPTLHRVGLLPRTFAPEAFRTVLDHGYGLTDLAKHASGSDAAIARSAYDVVAFTAKIARFQPKLVCFTSKQAAKIALEQAAVGYGPAGAIAGVPTFVLPSPSGLARGHWDEAWWQALADLTCLLAGRSPA